MENYNSNASIAQEKGNEGKNGAFSGFIMRENELVAEIKKDAVNAYGQMEKV